MDKNTNIMMLLVDIIETKLPQKEINNYLTKMFDDNLMNLERIYLVDYDTKINISSTKIEMKMSLDDLVISKKEFENKDIYTSLTNVQEYLKECEQLYIIRNDIINDKMENLTNFFNGLRKAYKEHKGISNLDFTIENRSGHPLISVNYSDEKIFNKMFVNFENLEENIRKTIPELNNNIKRAIFEEVLRKKSDEELSR